MHLAKTVASALRSSPAYQRRKREVVSFEDFFAKAAPPQPIPPTLYQTGASRKVSRLHYEDMMRFRSLNEDLSFVFFDDQAMNRYMADVWLGTAIYEVFDRAAFPQMKADIFRYCLIFERGGFYCDINKGIFHNLRGLCGENADFLLSFENNEAIIYPEESVAAVLEHPTKVVIQWGFGAAPGHRILELVIQAIPVVAKSLSGGSVHSTKDAILMTTGPGVFSRAVREYLQDGLPETLSQAGIDFNGHGRHRLAGTELSPSAAEAHYSRSKSRVILV